MKKFIITIIMIVLVMTMTGCSKGETEVEPYSQIVISDTVTMKIESVELEEMTTENVSKEYLEELEYNSQKNQW